MAKQKRGGGESQSQRLRRQMDAEFAPGGSKGGKKYKPKKPSRSFFKEITKGKKKK